MLSGHSDFFKGRVCSLVARALIATRRRASMAPRPSAFDSPDANAPVI